MKVIAAFVGFSVLFQCSEIDNCNLQRLGMTFLNDLKKDRFTWRHADASNRLKEFAPLIRSDLIEMTRSTDDLLRARAAWALVKSEKDTKNTMQVFIQIIQKGRSSLARRTAISALVEMGGRALPAANTLILQAASFDEMESEFAENAIKSIGIIAMPTLAIGCLDSDVAVRAFAAKCLISMLKPDMVPVD